MLLEVKTFMAKNIGKRFKVDPSNQDITLLNDLITLKDSIDIKDIISELVAPRLLAALQLWLGHDQKKLKEVWLWYQGWK